MDLNTTVVSVNFMTKPLIQKCFESFRSFYPEIPFVIVDNGSRDASVEYLKRLADKPGVTVLFNDDNLGHGPALHQGVQQVTTPYVFTVDSDCTAINGGFLEPMLLEFQRNPNLFSLGDVHPAHKSGPYKYVTVTFMLMSLSKYLTLPPFIDHGAPAIQTMIAAQDKGYLLGSFPIADFVSHIGGGTSRMFSYAQRSWHPPRESYTGIRG